MCGERECKQNKRCNASKMKLVRKSGLATRGRCCYLKPNVAHRLIDRVTLSHFHLQKVVDDIYGCEKRENGSASF